MTRRQGIAALTFAAMAWASVYVIVKAVLGQIGPLQLSVLRLAIGSLVLLPIAWKQGFRPSVLKTRTYWLFGLTGVALYQGLQNMALVYTSPLNVALVLATVPAAVTLFAVVFLCERIGWLSGIGLVLAISGAAVLSIGAKSNALASNPLLGNLMMVAAVFVWATYTTQGKRLSTDQPAIVSTEAGFFTGLIYLLPLAIGETIMHGPPQLTWSGTGAILYLAIVPLAMAFYAWNQALRTVKASVAGLYVNLIPVLGVVIALLVGETMSLNQVIGGALTLAGVWLSTWANRDKSQGTP